MGVLPTTHPEKAVVAMAETDPDLLAQIQRALAARKGNKPSPTSQDGAHGPTSPTPPETTTGVSCSGTHDKEEGNEPDATANATSNGSDAAQAFRDKWEGRTEGLERFWRLLASPQEDDFSGTLVVDDDYYQQEFIDDMAKLLADLGKIKDQSAVQRAGAPVLSAGIAQSLMNPSKSARNVMKTSQLNVISMLGQYPPEGMPESAQKLFISALGHIVDGRYVLLVGTDTEVADFIRSNPTLAPTFGENLVRLSGMSTDGIFKTYRENLDEELRREVSADFEARFRDYVEFNADLLLYKGRELADYLSKEANATGSLVLPKERYTNTSLDEMLDQVVGLDDVKETIRGLEQYAVFRKRAEGHGSILPPSNMHMAFLGNPGTGKTTVARLISTMLFKIGIIRTNKLIEVSTKDLIAEYVGHTDKRVHDKVTEALGGVLFIDEAYALMPEGERSVGYGAEAIAELVKCMEDYKDDLIVILAGYDREMQGLIDSNPGLASRIGYTFHFSDYTVDELLEICRLQSGRSGLTLTKGTEDALRRLFAYFSRFKSFGNGRFVGEVVQKALVKHAKSCASDTANTRDDYLTIRPEDVPTRQEMFDSFSEGLSAADMLEPLVGLGKVKESIMGLEQTVQFREIADKAGMRLPEINLNMVFRGNPGTGKTTVARIVGKVLSGIGAIPRTHFEELEARDLLRSEAGGTARETGKAIDRAMGGVLFIDEAYALMEDPTGREALATLVKAMEDHKGELVVMFAGYEREMRAFIDANPGLASRIGYTFDFEDYEPDDLLEIFRRKIDASGLTLGEGVEEGARDAFRYFHSVESFGNGRFVDRYLQEVIAGHARHYMDGNPATIAKESLPTIKHLCEISATDVLDCTDEEEEAALRRVAIHEAGHAVCRLHTTGRTDIVLITVEHEGNGALGYVQHERSRLSLPTERDLRNELVSLLGGMAGEDVYLGSFSTGNSSDLDKATAVAQRFVATYGMSRAGLVQYVGETRNTRIEDLPPRVLDEMRSVLDECLAEAKDIISSRRKEMDAIVQALSESSTLTGKELMDVWQCTNHNDGSLCTS